jgi:hypothetical protein
MLNSGMVKNCAKTKGAVGGPVSERWGGISDGDLFRSTFGSHDVIGVTRLRFLNHDIQKHHCPEVTDENNR